MDFQFHGANCLTVTTKQARLTVDDNLADLGAKPVGKHGDVALFTGPHGNTAAGAKLLVDRPGEYEVSGVSVYGIQARAHMDEEGKMTATMYKLVVEDISALITGHIYPELSDDQLEAIGMVDVMIVPVGGNGYTLDGIGALKLIKKIEPKLIIPTHYDDSTLQFPVPQQSLEQVLKSLAMEPKETVPRLKLNVGFVSESMDLVVVTRS
jgi:L-ascorbate metabolism protein UlaG (beta-lactamase superfamily)